MSISFGNPSVASGDSELTHIQFPRREPPALTATAVYQRVLALCTSDRTRAVANLWFDFHEQRGANAFFTAPHPFVVAQFNAIHRTLRKHESRVSLAQQDGADAPSIGHEIVRDEAAALGKMVSEKERRTMRPRYLVAPSNPWVSAQLHRLLLQAVSPNGLIPSLDNLARICRPLLYLYGQGARAPTSGFELLAELCGHRLVQHDLRVPLTLDPLPSTPIQRLPYADRVRGMPHPFLGVILHEEIQRDDFLELDTLPVALAELNPRYKYSDDRKLGRDPEDLFLHDVRLHGHFLARFSGLRGLTGQKLLVAIESRVRFAEAFERAFPKGSLYREAASIIRFGLHHEGWFAYMFGNQFFPENFKGTGGLIYLRTRATHPMNQYVRHLFSNAGPWLEDSPEPRHSLEWFERLRYVPKEASEEFLIAVGKSLPLRCVPEDLGRTPNANQIPLVVPHYWELVRSVADASPQ